MVWVKGLGMVRTMEDNAVVHLWHPPVNNPVWQDPAKVWGGASLSLVCVCSACVLYVCVHVDV